MTANRSVLIIGGTSDIGFATARAYAEKGWGVVLTGRSMEALERNRRDLETRYAVPARAIHLDILDSASFADVLNGLDPFPDTAVCVAGLLGNQAEAQSNPVHAATVMRSNYEGPALLLGEIAEYMARRGRGTIVGISSVAGDRGRGSNYVYGSAKAGFTAFLSGLRNRLVKNGVHVLTVKPGFVRTNMTAGLNLPPPITAMPEEVGAAIYQAAEIKKRDVIYIRPVWRLIMAIICAIPETLFKKLKL